MGDTGQLKVGESPSLLIGQGRFIDDETRPGMLHMAVLRSPVAHGVISALDVEAARAIPGVACVLTAEDLAAEGIGPIGIRAPLEDVEGEFHQPRRPALAEGKVVYVGQPVAAVVAESVDQALDALEVIELDIDTMPVVIDPMVAKDADPIWPGIPYNTAFEWQNGNQEETARLIAEADHVVSCAIAHPRIAISPIETRGCLAEHADGRFTLTTPSQGVVSLRSVLSGCLGIAPSDLRVITHDVGGSFAARIWPYPEQLLALVAARRTGRPVKCMGTRSEAFIGDVPGRARVDQAELALDAEGRFLAFRINATADLGAFINTAAPGIVTLGAVRCFGQVYDIPGQHYRVRAVFTNAHPTDAFRGAGKPESTATLERLIDMAARNLGMDRVEIRRLNLVQPGQLPLATPMGEIIDSGDFPGLADKVLEMADWAGLPDRKAESRAKGLLRGAGFGFQLHASGGSTLERSEVRALPDGTVLVRTGMQDSGQGHRQSLAIVAAEALDIPIERIRVEQGDSDWLEKGGGTGGSNLMPVAGNTVHRTALAMIDRARETAAELLEAAEADIEYGKGTFHIAGTDRSVGLAQIAQYLEEDDNSCVAQLDFEGNATTWPSGANVCEIELDPETGSVRVDRYVTINDLGRVVNEPAALGQLLGGIGQGIGEALSEGMIFDSDGQPLSASFMDYGLPRPDDVPFVAHAWAPTPSPNALIGAKGVGELPSNGTPAVVVNAVLDAIAGVGEMQIDKPLTPGKIWAALST